MDSELFTAILALVTAGWTAFQEYRHRKVAAKPVRPSDMLKAKPKKEAP